MNIRTSESQRQTLLEVQALVVFRSFGGYNLLGQLESHVLEKIVDAFSGHCRGLIIPSNPQ
jgi:hypothetical protein